MKQIWWLHLIIRRETPLKRRCVVFERVLRAVGSFTYVEHAVPLLLRLLLRGNCCIYETANKIRHRGYDLPAEIGVGYRKWARMEKLCRDDAPEVIWMTGGFVDELLLGYGGLHFEIFFSYTLDSAPKMLGFMHPRKDHVSSKTP